LFVYYIFPRRVLPKFPHGHDRLFCKSFSSLLIFLWLLFFLSLQAFSLRKSFPSLLLFLLLLLFLCNNFFRALGLSFARVFSSLEFLFTVASFLGSCSFFARVSPRSCFFFGFTSHINRDLMVHILIGGFPDCYQFKGHAAEQQNLPFIEAHRLPACKYQGLQSQAITSVYWLGTLHPPLSVIPQIRCSTN
jgi:hypothetical protein